MTTYQYPEKSEWPMLCKRCELSNKDLDQVVLDIINQVKNKQDAALYALTEKFDRVALDTLLVSPDEMKSARQKIAPSLAKAIETARENISTFHQAQQSATQKIETTKGVQCWRKSVAIEKVGLYIPGGSAPLFSSILMLAIPARIAGCKEIILCTPPDQNGQIHPAILYTAQVAGLHKIVKTGGAQAIAAMAYGTESVPKVDKIFGPGNQYVTKAKELVQQNGVAIDMPAGPSEVLLIADRSAKPEFLAADILAQAEHGPDSQAILLSNDIDIIEQTLTALNQQLEQLPRKEIARQALDNSRAILLKDLESCFAFSNYYAPEHLILATENSETCSGLIENAGSVFLGNYSCESAGDYASGTNHTLPTNGFAKSYSGVSLDSFVKKITFQKLSESGIQNLGPTIEVLAEAEGLWAHKNAVTLRLKSISDV